MGGGKSSYLKCGSSQWAHWCLFITAPGNSHSEESGTKAMWLRIPSCGEMKIFSVNRVILCMLCFFPKGNPSVELIKMCGIFQGRNGKWENVACNQKLGYICQKRNSSIVDDSFIVPSGMMSPEKRCELELMLPPLSLTFSTLF